MLLQYRGTMQTRCLPYGTVRNVLLRLYEDDSVIIAETIAVSGAEKGVEEVGAKERLRDAGMPLPVREPDSNLLVDCGWCKVGYFSACDEVSEYEV